MKANQKRETLVFKSAKKFKAFLKTVKFMPCAFNRAVADGHKDEMVTSIKELDIQRNIVLIWTNVFDGEWAYYVADGQHLVRAILEIDSKNLKGCFVCQATRKEKIKDIIRFVSIMNTTAKKWSLDNYLDAWATEGNQGYKYLKDIRIDKKFGLSGLVEAYSSIVGKTDPFKKGDFVPNKTIGDTVIKLYESAVKVGLRDCNSTFLAIVRWGISNKINRTQLLKGIKSNQIDFGRKFGRDAYISLFNANCK